MKSSPRRVENAIVTGGTGVTGNALVRYLLNKGIKVTAIVRPNSARRKFLPVNSGNLKIIECNLGEYSALPDSLFAENYDAFFHLAWDGSMGKEKVANRNNFALQIKNAQAAIVAVELCNRAHCGTFVMTGSQAEYGTHDCTITEETAKRPCNGYGIAKLCAEQMTRLLCATYGINHIWPILFSIYGPNDTAQSLIDTTLRGLMQGQTLSYTKGEQIWDYLYSYDAAEALLLLAQHGKNGESYNVANGNARPLAEYIAEMYEVAACSAKPRLGEVPYAKNQQMLLSADITKLQRDTAFQPKYSFKRGIAEILATLENEAE